MSIGPSGIRWSQVGPRNFIGNGPSVKTSVVPLATRFQSNLVAEDLAARQLTATVRSRAQDAGGQAVLRAAKLGDCEAKLRFEFRRTGD